MQTTDTGSGAGVEGGGVEGVTRAWCPECWGTGDETGSVAPLRRNCAVCGGSRQVAVVVGGPRWRQASAVIDQTAHEGRAWALGDQLREWVSFGARPQLPAAMGQAAMCLAVLAVVCSERARRSERLLSETLACWLDALASEATVTVGQFLNLEPARQVPLASMIAACFEGRWKVPGYRALLWTIAPGLGEFLIAEQLETEHTLGRDLAGSLIASRPSRYRARLLHRHHIEECIAVGAVASQLVRQQVAVYGDGGQTDGANGRAQTDQLVVQARWADETAYDPTAGTATYYAHRLGGEPGALFVRANLYRAMATGGLAGYPARGPAWAARWKESMAAADIDAGPMTFVRRGRL